MNVDRRTFQKLLLGAVMAAGGCATSSPPQIAARRKIRELSVAVVGIGSRGETVLREILRAGANVVALCDPDSSALRMGGDGVEVFRHTKPALYRDWRIMFMREKNLDAVFVCTPDHLHFKIAAAAIEAGASVCIEPPAVRTVDDWRRLVKAAARAGVSLTVGRGDADPDALAFAENCLRGGVVGRPDRIIAWTNQPLWPQGICVPEGCDALPRNLDWELWTGDAPMRPWRNGYYLHGAWRAWRDFGSGAWGAVAPHLLRTAFVALELGAPGTIETLRADRGADGAEKASYPASQSLRFSVERGERSFGFGRRPTVEVIWHDGVGDASKAVAAPYGLKLPPLPAAGCLICGSAGTWLSAGPLADRHYFAVNGEATMADAESHPACSAFLPEKKTGRGRLVTQYKRFLEGIAAGEFSAGGKYDCLFNETIAKGIML